MTYLISRPIPKNDKYRTLHWAIWLPFTSLIIIVDGAMETFANIHLSDRTYKRQNIAA